MCLPKHQNAGIRFIVWVFFDDYTCGNSLINFQLTEGWTMCKWLHTYFFLSRQLIHFFIVIDAINDTHRGDAQCAAR